MMRSARSTFGGVMTLCTALFVCLGTTGCSDDSVSDAQPPAPIADLAAVPNGFTSVRLTWTAPGDDGDTGRALRYRTVFATNARTLDILSFCGAGLLALPDKTPKFAGEPETLVVNGLTPGQTYSFRVQTEDPALNRSVSNLVNQTLTESTPPQARWQFLGPDAFDSVILRLAPVGGDLVAVGPFTKIGSQPANRAARWDGGAWQAMDQGLPTVNASADTGITGLTLRSVTNYQGRPVVCGGLTRRVGGTSKSFAYVAIWNGASWDSLQTRAAGDAYDVISYDGALVVAGTFTKMDTLADVGGIARWDGVQWRRIGAAKTFSNPAFVTLATDGGALVAAGSFDSTTTVRSKRVAAWNGSTWSAWGAGDPSGTIFSTAFFNGSLILGGNFGVRRMAQGGVADTLAGNISKVNCSTSSANALLPLPNNTLVVGGNFNQVGSLITLSLATWNGTAWTAFGRHENLGVSALAYYNQQIVVSSGFASADGLTSPIRVAAWGQ